MSFTRTAHGIANYRRFYGAEVVVYIEGKEEKYIGASKRADEAFYGALIGTLLNSKSIKVKVVGNKSNALSYHKKIVEGNLKNSIVFIDRDIDDVVASIVSTPNLYYTYGYSWENDLWSLELCRAVLGDLTFGNVDADNTLKHNYTLGKRRLSGICLLDIGCQINGSTILPKNKGACGVNFCYKSKFLINRREWSRLSLKFRSLGYDSCALTRALIVRARSLDIDKVIQGHLWEHASISMLGYLYKRESGAASAPNEMIKRIALSTFARDPKRYLTPESLAYYQGLALA